MPYASNEEIRRRVPAVRNLPAVALSIFRNVVNSALKDGDPEGSAFRQAWGAVRNAGWHKNPEGKWVKTAKAESESEPDKDADTSKSFDAVTKTIKIAKIDEEHRVVYGWMSVVEKGGQPVIDLQGDVIPQDELERMLWEYVQSSRAVGEMHERVMDGDAGLVAAFPVIDETIPMLKQAIDEGLRGALVAFRVDAESFAKVKSGELTMLSIGGIGIREDMLEAA